MVFSARFTSTRGAHLELNGTLASPMVTAEENEWLTKPVSDDEIYNAVFQMDPHKAPGSDGFGASFFQDHWVTIKDLLSSAIKDFSMLGNF